MIGSELTRALEQEFFRWFSLERYEAPRTLADGSTWHGFRPSGERYKPLVTVNLETDGERIRDATLCLDRAFIEHPKDGPFARDIAAGYLRWALSADQQAAIGGFLNELGDLGPNVIRLSRTPPVPSGDPSPLYRVFLGSEKTAEQSFPGAVLRLNNLQAREGSRDPRHDWIWIRVVGVADPS
jgi:hypothetical protein